MKARFVSTRVYDIKFDVSSVETSSKKPTLIDNTTLLNGIDDLTDANLNELIASSSNAQIVQPNQLICVEKGDSHYALIRASDFTNERVQNASPVHIDKNDEDEVVEIDDEDNEQQQVLVNGDDNDATLFMCPACEACYEAENECEQHILEVHADEFADDDCDEDEAHSFAEHDTEALEESDTMLEEEEEVDNDADKYEQDDGSDATNDDDYLSEEDEKSFVHQQEKNTSKRHGDAQQQPPNSERKKAKTSEQDEDEIDVC